MATLHVIFDPTGKITVPPAHQRPKGMGYAMLAVPDLVDDHEEIEALARKLATLLLEQMKVVA